MNRYSLYCTPEQTRKALELGAPIKEAMSRYNAWNALQRIKSGKETYEEYANKGVAIINGKYIVKALTIPTAEQMIGWLEEQYLYITIRYTNDVAKHWQADIDHACFIDPKCGESLVDFNFSSRKEAALAAIDAALNYLSKKQNEV